MLWIILALAALIVVMGIVSYNKIVAMRQLSRNAWSDVDVYLKRRAELVPNLVTSVKAYAVHEQNTLEGVVQARNQALSANGPTPDRAAAEANLTSGLSRITMIAEAYPELKANQNFLNLQHELTETERLIASARQYYNACVRDYNTMLQAFPSNLVANTMQLKPLEFFEVDTPTDRQAPTIGSL